MEIIGKALGVEAPWSVQDVRYVDAVDGAPQQMMISSRY
jgi:hypothetical protein